jgi:hypothetical protein
MPTRCCICHGERQVGELRDRVYVEPRSGEDAEPEYTRGWMCEECAVVHWAWVVTGGE